MEKRTKILAVAAFICIVACIVMISILAKLETDSINKLYTEVTKRKTHTITQQKSEVKTKKDTENKFEEEETKRGMVKKDFDKYVFVGDSRYRGMMFMADESDVFICENGRGYDFLLEQMGSIKWECDENTALIIGLGVNDSHYNVDKYLTTLSDMADTMDCQIYYMLVNPVDEAVEEYNGYHVLNENIDIFNERMKNELDERIGIIDTNSYLLESGFDTMDGLHYTNDTYEKIYNFIKSEVTE